ncbi:MAG: hypothetical protein ABJN69_06810 [Hellea sp.]
MKAHLRKPIFEQAFVRKLKTRPILTFFITFVLLFIPYVILAKIYGVPIFNGDGTERVKVPHLFAWAPSWTAFAMSSFLSLLLSIEQYGQRQKSQIEVEFLGCFSNGAKVLETLHGFSRKSRIVLAVVTGLGLMLGVISAFLLVIVPAADMKELLLTPRPWFILTGITLVTFSVRFIYMTYNEHRKLKEAMDIAKLHSLFTKTPQSLFVKIALRRLLSWMLLTGLSSVFLFRGEDISIVAWPWILVAIFMSGFSFISALDIGHKLILRHKNEARKDLNESIQKLFETGLTKPAEATKLTALVALENRVQSIPEWTITMPVAFKILSFFLIPLATWISATLVRELVISSLQ